MKIAFLTSGFSRNRKEATAITIISLAKEIAKRGHKVVIISKNYSRTEGLLPEYEKIGNISVYRFCCSRILGKLNDILAHVKGVNYVQEKLGIKFDVIHNFSNAPILALRASMAKEEYSKNAMLIQTIKAESGNILGSLIFSGTLNKMDAVTVPTGVLADKLIKWGCKKNRIKIIKSNIDLKKFSPKDKNSLKKKYGYEEKKIVFYYGAVRKKGKGIRYLIESVPFVAEKNPDALYIIAPRNRAYEKDYGKIGGKNIKIVQDVKIEDYVNLADIVVLPYENLVSTEGNPSCLLESMACRKPIVTTNLPEINEIVSDYKEVLMAEPKNPWDLAEKINALLKNKKLRQKLAKNAYKKSLEFDVKKIARQFLRLYKNG